MNTDSTLAELDSARTRLEGIIRVLEQPTQDSWALITQEFAGVAECFETVNESNGIGIQRAEVVEIVKLMQRANLLLTNAALFYAKGFSPQSYSADGRTQMTTASRVLVEC